MAMATPTTHMKAPIADIARPTTLNRGIRRTPRSKNGIPSPNGFKVPGEPPAGRSSGVAITSVSTSSFRMSIAKSRASVRPGALPSLIASASSLASAAMRSSDFF